MFKYPVNGVFQFTLILGLEVEFKGSLQNRIVLIYLFK